MFDDVVPLVDGLVEPDRATAGRPTPTSFGPLVGWFGNGVSDPAAPVPPNTGTAPPAASAAVTTTMPYAQRMELARATGREHRVRPGRRRRCGR